MLIPVPETLSSLIFLEDSGGGARVEIDNGGLSSVSRIETSEENGLQEEARVREAGCREDDRFKEDQGEGPR
jgi:hypothetical protein